MKKDSGLVAVYGTTNNMNNPVGVTADEVLATTLARMFYTAGNRSYSTPEMLGEIFNLPDEFTDRIKSSIKIAHIKRLIEVANIEDLDHSNVIIAEKIPKEEYINWNFYPHTLIAKESIYKVMGLPKDFTTRRDMLIVLLAINDQTPYKNCLAGDTAVWRGYAKGGASYYAEITGLQTKDVIKSLQLLEKHGFIVSIRPTDVYDNISELPLNLRGFLWHTIPRHIIKRPEYTDEDIEEIVYHAIDNALYHTRKALSSYEESEENNG